RHARVELELGDQAQVGLVEEPTFGEGAISPYIRSHGRDITYVRPCTSRRDGGILQVVQSRVPPHLYFVGSAVFHYLGPSFAVLLFARVDVLGVAWLRIASAAVVMGLWRRPWRRFVVLARGDQALVVALGAVFAVMNACFYVAIDRLPLATVAAIEFVGPIALALVGARSARNWLAVVAASVGVYMITHVHFGGQPVGIAFALANALLFTLYIVLAHRVARSSAMSG